MSRLIQTSAPQRWAFESAAAVAELMRAAIEERGAVSLALAGGGTPMPVYTELAKIDLAWEHVTLFFGDERCVPPTSEHSNYRASREAFGEAVSERATFVTMNGEHTDPAQAAADYAAGLPADGLDLILLGMGGDGHTASLFPGDRKSLESTDLVVPVIGPKPPPQRLTLTPAAIAEARHVVVLVNGAGKAARIASIFEGDDLNEFPIRVALSGTWLLDTAAASQL